MRRPDALLILCLALAAGIYSYQGSLLLGPGLLKWSSDSLWFEADVPRHFSNMTDRSSFHNRNKVHPLSSLATYTPVFALRLLFGSSPATAARLVIAGAAGLWISLLYTLFRVLDHPRLDALAFTVLAASSASSIFWLPVPETYLFGSVTILLTLLVAALAERRALSAVPYVLASAASLSFTVTNWMFGLLLAGTVHSWRKALRISLMALVLVASLWPVQKLVFRSSGLFLDIRGETKFLALEGWSGALSSLRAATVHSMVMPEISQIEKPEHPGRLVLSIQESEAGSRRPFGAIAAGLWLALLGIGLWELFRQKSHRAFRWVLGLGLCGQLTLHTLYGDETFLYALHYGPLLVILASLAARGPLRHWALLVSASLILFAVLNNLSAFFEAATALHKLSA